MSDDKALYDLKKKVKMLSQKRGRHTELITVYVPDGYNMDKINSKLAEEQGTASNIKSATTRKNVTTALTKILQHLKLFKRTPANGLAVFCGNVSEQEGREDFLMESINPPKPIKVNLYRCSQRFVLDPLKDMLEKRETYGLIVIDRRDADIALLKGTRVETLARFDSLVPGKFRAGGQSAQRFERVIEGMAKDFYKKVGTAATQSLREIPELKGILVGGPGPTKNEFLDTDYLSTELKKKVLAVLDIGYTGEQGIDELIKKSEDIISEAEIVKEKKLIEKFLGHIAKDTGLAAYGEKEVRAALLAGAVEILLISEGLDEDLLEELTELGNQVKSEVELISTETKEGQQLLNLGGVAAILRFKQQ